MEPLSKDERREQATRGALLRREARDLVFVAQESSLPTDLVLKAHQARMRAIAVDPKISSITETEAMVSAVLEAYVPPMVTVDTEANEQFIRRRILKRLVNDLEFPTPKNAAVAEYQARILMRVKQFIEKDQ